jgi:hypothetical protein
LPFLPERFTSSAALQAKSNGLDTIAYVKRLDDGTIAHVEEVRTGRKRLAAVTMRKHPAEMNVDDIAATSTKTSETTAGVLNIL